MRSALHAGFIFAVLMPGLARANNYVATSNSATSVTGDIAMDDAAITFANGTKLEFSDLVADKFVVFGDEVGASVYKVKAPADPKLANGNRLCGSGKVTFVATWGVGEEATAVAVFTGRKAPTDDTTACTTYVYDQ